MSKSLSRFDKLTKQRAFSYNKDVLKEPSRTYSGGGYYQPPQRKFYNFSRFNYFTNRELLSPRLHYIDSDIVDRYSSRSIRRLIHDGVKSDIYTIFKKKCDAYGFKEEDFRKEISLVQEKMPEELPRDMYNQYHSDITKLKFKDRTKGNSFVYKLLDKINDPITKVITNQSNLKSLIFTGKMYEYFVYSIAFSKLKDPDKADDAMSDLKQGYSDQSSQSQNDSNQDSQQQPDDKQPQDSSQASKGSSKDKNPIKDSLEDLLTNDKTIEKIIQKAKQEIENLEKVYSDEEMDGIWKDIQTGSDMSSIDPKEIEQMKKELENLKLNKDSIKKSLKNIVDKSISYFNFKQETVYDEFLNNPALDYVTDLHYLHPKLRIAFIDDLQVKDIRKSGRIDVYLDKSGSMNGSCTADMTKMNFIKALTLKLNELDVLDEIYSFRSSVDKPFKYSLKKVLAMSSGGGTCLDSVIKNIKEVGKNALVVTDAEDRVNIYTEKAFIIGIPGSNFCMFSPNILEKYAANKQIMLFDGDRLYYVDKNGKIIK